MDSKDAVSVMHADTVDETLKVGHVDPVGTVRLIDHNEVVLIPTPSPDSRGNTALQALVYHFDQFQIHSTFRDCTNGPSL